MNIKHPAKYTDVLLPYFANMLKGNEKVLDPFGGIGKIYSLLQWHPDLLIDAVEIEPEWANYDKRITVGNALDLQWEDDYFDVILTSPTYGNRMSDKMGKGKWALTRNSYAAYLHRELSPNNSGSLQWGNKYRKFHIQAWMEARRVLKNKGIFILNIKNHIRKGIEQKVTEWHSETLQLMGFEMLEHIKVDTPSLRKGENGNVRVSYESIIKFILYK